MEDNKIINDEMTVLLRQLVMQNQIGMAGHVLKAYFIRQWKTNEELANKYVRGYFFKYYPNQLERHLKRINGDNKKDRTAMRPQSFASKS